ncbi:MAG: 2,3-bisphosphoglycerate-independent phosphoglycerate mutase [Alphaproteobacteria bacterium]
MTARPKPVVLTILDGWGHSDSPENNAIAAAHTPHWDMLVANYPNGLINASELHVGLPEGQMGNSEVGHMNIGSGRVIMQELPRIDAAIKDGSLAAHLTIKSFADTLKKSGGACHLMGLVSPGGVHSHQRHIAALARILAAQGVRVFIHAFLDGRDTPPQSAKEYVNILQNDISDVTDVRIATVSGRYYAMDRDKRWERVEKAYAAIVTANARKFSSVEDVIEQSYAEHTTDEFVLPAVVGEYTGMKDGDGVFMANFRADRVRQLLGALLNPAFKEFSRSRVVRLSSALGMVEYSKELGVWMQSVFMPEPLTDILGEVVSNAGLKQLRIAETEKYAHVTFFFNGGREQEFVGEERILVPSPKVATYDMKPEMSAPEVTDKLVEAINADRFDFIVVNYANTDMVGHTGDLQAAVKAVEAVDTCLGRLSDAVFAKGGVMLITADHGNAEQLFDGHTGQAHTAHTLNLVPVIIASAALKGKKIQMPEGKLGDVAPTLLELMDIPKPATMTGNSLLAGYAA